MIIFENVILKVFQLLIAEGTAMMTVYSLFDTAFAVYMAASCNVTIINWVEAYCTLKLCLELLWVYFKVDVTLVLFVYHHWSKAFLFADWVYKFAIKDLLSKKASLHLKQINLTIL